MNTVRHLMFDKIMIDLPIIKKTRHKIIPFSRKSFECNAHAACDSNNFAVNEVHGIIEMYPIKCCS